MLDGSDAPIGDATVSGPSSATVYYLNEPYVSPGGEVTFNTTGTVASAGSLFVIPAAPIYSYSASADGYTFSTTLLAGSQPGFAVVVRFRAD